ncbi:MAG: hypothetical protein OEZ58_15245 [Gammaproteobacteria bacterium]|nr:hypothetical protein [Gammaproteobacteria bacterium]
MNLCIQNLYKTHTTKSNSHVSTIAILLFVSIFFSHAILAETYTLFETGQVRPLALSENGKILFAINTPDNRLEAFAVNSDTLKPISSVRVGIEPVAIALASENEVWVVNHISDSVSIVDTSNIKNMYVKQTLLVGDEPRDIVFAGENNQYAFITTAHRGQNSPIDPQLTTPGVARADVWVFKRGSDANTMGGKAETILSFFTDTPRALTVSPDGKKVYVAGFKTGNQTTTIFETTVSFNGGLPNAVINVDMNGDGFAEPHEINSAGEVQPSTGLIVKYDGQHWRDDKNRIWDDQVKFNLPDKDVFVIDAMSNPPVAVEGSEGFYRGVGTVLFNMVSNPVSGKVYVSNLEARNQIRFEGPGGGGSTVQAHNVESRITVLDQQVTPIHLNKHIDRSQCCEAIPNETNAKSLAFPTAMAVSKDGKYLYVAALGSAKVGVYDTQKLESDSFENQLENQVLLSAGGPSGVVLSKQEHFLYVLTRFDNGISIIDTRKKKEIAHVSMFNPESENIVNGRQFLYDAAYTSSTGDQACAGCHIFGDMDNLAWDLGNPDGSDVHNPGPLKINHESFGLPVDPNFKPMKGPMTTQSLRGLANHGPMHWRGDRHGGGEGIINAQPDQGAFDEVAAFNAFNPAFVGLIGRDQSLSADEMQAFADFALEITYPPNPIRALDNSLSDAQQAGKDFFFDESKIVDTVFHCNGCHTLDRNANKNYAVNKPGFFGTDGSYTFAFQPQFFKVPHLRNMYQKVGKFGMSNSGFFLADDPFSGDPFFNANQHRGDQVRGFGFFHDGSVDTLFRFHNIVGFLPRPEGAVTPLDPGNPASLPISEAGMTIRRNLEEYLMVFDSNLFPIVGQQVTISKANFFAAIPRLRLLKARAELGECDLIASQGAKGFFYAGNDKFLSNYQSYWPITSYSLLYYAWYKPVTFTCAVPGNGVRIALDRDEDGVFDEIARLPDDNQLDGVSTTSTILDTAGVAGGL